jgi:transposase
MLTPVLPFPLPGLVVERVSTVQPTLLIDARTSTPEASCPDCHTPSARVHSRYTRCLRDLPVAEHPVRLRLAVRRFRCLTPTCPRRTFAERLPALAPWHAQRTGRLTETVRVLGSEAGGEAGARMVHRLRMPLSGDTVLRILQSTPAPPRPTPRVLGIDDFALRKGRVYGTILVDLEQQRPIDLLPERTADTVATWLRAHPGVEVIARDRASDYARGATEGAPEATQVADRFHLLCNLREALTRYLQRITPVLRRVLASESAVASPAPPKTPAATPTAPPVPGSVAPAPAMAQGTSEGATLTRPLPRYGRPPRLQQEQSARHAARVHRYEQVKIRFAQGQSLRQIAAACGLNTKTVRSWVRSEALPLDQRGYRGVGKIDPYTTYLQTRLTEGCTNQSRLWREIRAQGFTGTRSLVAKWIHAHGLVPPGTPPPAAPPLPAARQLAWLVLKAEEQRTFNEHALWTRLQQHDELQQVAALVCQGTMIIRQRQADALDAWLKACGTSPSVELRNCAEWLQRDYAAVQAALTLPWSTGPVEGQINRLKLIKRSGYGRMQLGLLRQRVLYDAA